MVNPAIVDIASGGHRSIGWDMTLVAAAIVSVARAHEMQSSPFLKSKERVITDYTGYTNSLRCMEWRRSRVAGTVEEDRRRARVTLFSPLLYFPHLFETYYYTSTMKS